MQIADILFIAFGLAMDAFAVSVSGGVAIRELKVRDAFRIALFFGAFQGIMPLLGWLSGMGLANFISGIDHWIAFSLLSFIGAKMIYESGRPAPSERKYDYLNIYVLLLLSVATSIDALAVGFGFAFIGVSVVTPIVIIGVVTFVLSFIGVFSGNRLGHVFGNKMEILGGLVLIGIGTKILIEHLG
ncbi:manganese efflux pump [candidate division TA06 bacterium]|uniref:Putative manganese efflux pump MntP n=1 Tax=candidate division TA06 bacterium TaxID=2250710 RepID=A0A523UQH1_UNCT6|nr:MAG: manganese efflux pump [candidate division TA06 bacterium]